jgi:homoserine dehydrogenase
MPGKRIAMGIVGPGLVGGELLRQLEATKVFSSPRLF